MDEGIRLATLMDHVAVVHVEQQAGQLFLGTPMEEIAADEAVSVDQFRTHVDGETAWVHQRGGVVVGYLLADRLDDAGHIEQVSVDPACAGRRIGAGLLDAATRWAAGQGLAMLTLTTFSEVPWNAPYYRRLGFRELGPECWGEQLAARVRAEADQGLACWPRIVMGRPASVPPR
ncbi:GNAT family N-acetyltransferase [Nesterenkonia suensis]